MLQTKSTLRLAAAIPVILCMGTAAAADANKSQPYLPIHPMQRPAPVPPGELIEYAIAMMPTSNVFQKGHSVELIIRNQDDILSGLGTWGVYVLPFMRTVRHQIHFGKSHLLLPVIPASGQRR